MFEEYYLIGLCIICGVAIVSWIYSAVMHAKTMKEMKKDTDAKLAYHKRPSAPTFPDNKSRYVKNP